MPDPSQNIPAELVERLGNLDLSNPQDLEQLFALEAELRSIVEDDPDNIPPAEIPPEDPSIAYLAAADPTIYLDEFTKIVNDDIQQLIHSQTLLFPACITGALDKTSWLLDQGLDLNHVDKDGYTPLIYASLPGDRANLDLIQLLITKGANLNATSNFDESPLKLLIRDGNYEGAQLLLTAGADPDPANFTPLHQATASGDLPNILSSLTPQTLEEQNCFERSPWLTAIHADQPSAAQLLQSQGANTKVSGQTGVTPLHLAAEANACNSIPYLLQQKHNLETRADFGNAPLHNAVENDSLEAAKLLLDAGADVHALTESVDAPISFADSLPILRLLEKHGANLNHLNTAGHGPLHNLAECDDLEAVTWLLGKGTNPNIPTTTFSPKIQTLIQTFQTK